MLGTCLTARRRAAGPFLIRSSRGPLCRGIVGLGRATSSSTDQDSAAVGSRPFPHLVFRHNPSAFPTRPTGTAHAAQHPSFPGRSFASTTPPQGEGHKGETKKKQTGVRALFREYGWPFVIVYNGLYLGTLAAIYTALEHEYVAWDDVLNALEAIPHIEQVVNLREIDPAKGKLGVAVCLNPLFEPLRIGTAVATAKPLARVWAKWRKK